MTFCFSLLDTWLFTSSSSTHTRAVSSTRITYRHSPHAAFCFLKILFILTSIFAKLGITIPLRFSSCDFRWIGEFGTVVWFFCCLFRFSEMLLLSPVTPGQVRFSVRSSSSLRSCTDSCFFTASYSLLFISPSNSMWCVCACAWRD